MQSKNFVRGGVYGGQQKMGKLSERGVHKKTLHRRRRKVGGIKNDFQKYTSPPHILKARGGSELENIFL